MKKTLTSADLLTIIRIAEGQVKEERAHWQSILSRYERYLMDALGMEREDSTNPYGYTDNTARILRKLEDGGREKQKEIERLKGELEEARSVIRLSHHIESKYGVWVGPCPCGWCKEP